MAVASAGPYASLHLAPDRQPHQHPTTQFFTGRMPFLPPNQQRQSTEGTKPGSSIHDKCFWGRGQVSAGQMSEHTWYLGIRVCRDTISCPPRQLNCGCIEGYWHGQKPDRPTLTAHSHRQASTKRDTKRESSVQKKDHTNAPNLNKSIHRSTV